MAARPVSASDGGRAAIYVVESEGGVPQRLTNEPSEDGEATFSRDGRSIYFASDRSGRFEIWRIPATGGPAVQVTHGGGVAAQESWDARHVYYSKTEAGKDLWRVPVEGGVETPVPGVQPAAELRVAVGAAVAAGVDGLFIETHPEPARAHCDAASQYPLDKLEAFLAPLLELDAVVRKHVGE